MLFKTNSDFYQIQFILAAVQMEQSRNILLMDSDEKSSQDILRFLKVSAYAFSVSHASDISEGINYIKTRRPDLILLDANVIGQEDFLSFTQLTRTASIPIILLSEMTEAETRQQAEKASATDYLVKNKINLFHLQKSIANALKISEAEAKSDNTFSKLSSQNESLQLLLNKVNCGLAVLNEKSQLIFANEKAYGIISSEKWRTFISKHLSYQNNEQEETVEFTYGNKTCLRITTLNEKWNGEHANILILEETIIATIGEPLSENESAITLINSVRDNVLLLKHNQVVLANKNALLTLKAKTVDISGKSLSLLFEGVDKYAHNDTLAGFLQPQESTGFIRQTDGQLASVKFSIQPVMLEGVLHQLVLFNLIAKDEELSIPGARSEEDRFSSEGVLHLASHDLREPVRTILNYVQLIGENLKSKNYDEATEYANYAKDAAARMEKLLSDLKTYIGLNEHKFTLSKVSMKTSLTDVLRQLKPRLEEARAEISFAELPVVTADRELVEKLLLQLIDNALKFRKGEKNPVIDIGYDKFEGNTIFCVRDNGIGISRKYYTKIFNLFERLNRVDEFPGNGLGLPICKKITELHGGEIWVESLPGSGSNFYFTLKGK